MSDHIDGKVIVVTGAGGGFGRLISLKAAASGARVACADIVNPAAIVGILGQNASSYLATMRTLGSGGPGADQADPENIAYAALGPDYIADQLMHAINQPWGV